MSFCTQCGTKLFEDQACECAEAKQFCTECGTKLSGSQSCVCTAVPMPADDYVFQSGSIYPESSVSPAKEIMEEHEVTPEYTHYDTQNVPDYLSLAEDEIPVRQYSVVAFRNRIRCTCAKGYMHVTSKRVIFKAEGRGIYKHSAIHREFILNEVSGINAVSNYRFSILHFVVGIMSVFVIAALVAFAIFTGGWLVTNVFVSRLPVFDFIHQSFEQISGGLVVDVSRLSLIFGLVAGFGGATLYFMLRNKFTFKLALLGISLGGFFITWLTGSIFSYVLFGASALVCVYGLIMFAVLPDLVVSVYGRGGVCVDIIRAKSCIDSVFGRAGAGYAEAAPTPEAIGAICELGVVIADIQSMGDAGIKKWGM